MRLERRRTGSCSRIARGAELRQRLRACSTSASVSPACRSRRRSPASNSLPASTIASAASRRFVDVVQRVVEPEDVDAALGGGRDEAADEVAADGPRADEEAAAQRQRERRLRPRLQRADPLPRALDAAPDGGVEDAAARDLEVREAGAVEDLGEPEQIARSASRPASGSWPSRRIVVSTSAGTSAGA